MPAFAVAFIKFWVFRYTFAPGELVIRDGIVVRNERHIPYDRIQNMDLVQNPLHRMPGVALVRLETAGGDKPDAVLIELGANDGMRGLEPAVTKANLDAILNKIRSAGAEALLTGMLAPPNLGREYGAEFAALYPALARSHGVLYYPFFLEGVATRPELNQADRIHPNAAGVDIIVQRLLPKVKELLHKARNKKESGG